MSGCDLIDESKSKEDKTAQIGTVDLESYETIDELKISSLINFEIPPSVLIRKNDDSVLAGEDVVETHLNSSDKFKSTERCEMQDNIASHLLFFDEISYNLCVIENSTERFEIGKKYKFNYFESFSDDTDEQNEFGKQSSNSTSIWIAKSDNETLKVSMCRNDILVQTLTLTGRNSSGTKGDFKFFETIDEFSIALEGAIDNKFSNENRTKLSLKTDSTFITDDELRSQMKELELIDSMNYTLCT